MGIGKWGTARLPDAQINRPATAARWFARRRLAVRRSPPAPGSLDVDAPPRRTLAARPCGPAAGRLTSRGPRPPHAQCPHPRCCRRPPAPHKRNPRPPAATSSCESVANRAVARRPISVSADGGEIVRNYWASGLWTQYVICLLLGYLPSDGPLKLMKKGLGKK